MRIGQEVKIKGVKLIWTVLDVIDDHPIFGKALKVRQGRDGVEWIVPADRCEEVIKCQK